MGCSPFYIAKEKTFMSTGNESWSLLKPLLEAVALDLEESLALNESASLQTLRSRLLLKKCNDFLYDHHIAVVSLPTLSEHGKTPGLIAKQSLEKFIADIDASLSRAS